MDPTHRLCALLLLAALAGAASCAGHRTSWDALLDVPLPHAQIALRLDDRVTTPTETWGIKFKSLQTEIERITGQHLPIFIEAQAAATVVPGWEWPKGGENPDARGVSTRQMLAIMSAVGMDLKWTVTDHGLMILSTPSTEAMRRSTQSTLDAMQGGAVQ